MAYLLGSIPSAVWIGKTFYGIDVRDAGSGNSGATNTFRVLGKKAGIPVLFMDIFKGYLAVNLVYLINSPAQNQNFVLMQLILGTAAVLGHVLPVFSRFKGGKGIATLLGIILAVNPLAAAFAIIAFTFALLIFNFVSIASIIATVVFALSVFIFFQSFQAIMVPFALFLIVLVLLTHQKNIQRILNNEEGKVKIFKRK
ncbi:MAG: glycerol-3-phosphate 1-O-acyltransferase PlsY [Bacteroidetes bacterium]|nr:glycerol-3-phosphate 1-O-acyltransferase PlsY [Bacteroidota bacterium]